MSGSEVSMVVQGSALLSPEATAALDRLSTALGQASVGDGVDVVAMLDEATRSVEAIRARGLAEQIGDGEASIVFGIREQLHALDIEPGNDVAAILRSARDALSGAARFARAVRTELTDGGFVLDVSRRSVLSALAKAVSRSHRFAQVAKAVREDAHYGPLIVSHVERMAAFERAIAPMLREYCTEQEALDDPSVEAYERVLNERLGAAAREEFGRDTVTRVRAATGCGDRLVLDRLAAEGNGTYATAREAFAVDAGAWAAASRAALLDRVRELREGEATRVALDSPPAQRRPDPTTELQAARRASVDARWVLMRALGDGDPELSESLVSLADRAAKRIGQGSPQLDAEVAALVEGFRAHLAPGVESTAGVLYAVRNRLWSLEASVDALRGNSRDIGELLELNNQGTPEADLPGPLAVRNAVAQAVRDRDGLRRLLRGGTDRVGWQALAKVAKIVGAVPAVEAPDGAAESTSDDDWCAQVVEAVRAVAVRAKALTRVRATALLPVGTLMADGSVRTREQRAVAMHTVGVVPGSSGSGPDGAVEIDLVIPSTVLGEHGRDSARPIERVPYTRVREAAVAAGLVGSQVDVETVVAQVRALGGARAVFDSLTDQLGLPTYEGPGDDAALLEAVRRAHSVSSTVLAQTWGGALACRRCTGS